MACGKYRWLICESCQIWLWKHSFCVGVSCTIQSQTAKLLISRLVMPRSQKFDASFVFVLCFFIPPLKRKSASLRGARCLSRHLHTASRWASALTVMTRHVGTDDGSKELRVMPLDSADGGLAGDWGVGACPHQLHGQVTVRVIARGKQTGEDNERRRGQPPGWWQGPEIMARDKSDARRPLRFAN